MTRAVDQDSLMRFSPATGAPHPYPSDARQWRYHHGSTAWLFNPWTGERRTPEDVGSDTFGYLIRPSNASLQAGKSPYQTIACNHEKYSKGSTLVQKANKEGIAVYECTQCTWGTPLSGEAHETSAGPTIGGEEYKRSLSNGD